MEMEVEMEVEMEDHRKAEQERGGAARRGSGL